VSAIRTRAGQRLRRMFETEELPRGQRWPPVFDARLTERIVEELVPEVEEEAAAQPGTTIRMGDTLFLDWAGSASWGRIVAIGGTSREYTITVERIAGTSDGQE
jgi:hypothetical protein